MSNAGWTPICLWSHKKKTLNNLNPQLRHVNSTHILHTIDYNHELCQPSPNYPYTYSQANPNDSLRTDANLCQTRDLPATTLATATTHIDSLKQHPYALKKTPTLLVTEIQVISSRTGSTLPSGHYCSKDNVRCARCQTKRIPDILITDSEANKIVQNSQTQQ